MLELEVEAKWGESEEGSSTESSITAKGLMHCLIMSYGEDSGARGPSCVILGEALDQGGLSLLTSKVRGKNLWMEDLLLDWA